MRGEHRMEEMRRAEKEDDARQREWMKQSGPAVRVDSAERPGMQLN